MQYCNALENWEPLSEGANGNARVWTYGAPTNMNSVSCCHSSSLEHFSRWHAPPAPFHIPVVTEATEATHLLQDCCLLVDGTCSDFAIPVKACWAKHRDAASCLSSQRSRGLPPSAPRPLAPCSPSSPSSQHKLNPEAYVVVTALIRQVEPWLNNIGKGIY